jgi:hypothetical protein
VEADNDASVATIGSWVKVREEGDDEHEVLCLVEGRFANLAENKFHPDHTTSRALAGARAGDEVCMQAPAGTVKFTAVEVGREGGIYGEQSQIGMHFRLALRRATSDHQCAARNDRDFGLADGGQCTV